MINLTVPRTERLIYGWGLQGFGDTWPRTERIEPVPIQWSWTSYMIFGSYIFYSCRWWERVICRLLSICISEAGSFWWSIYCCNRIFYVAELSPTSISVKDVVRAISQTNRHRLQINRLTVNPQLVWMEFLLLWSKVLVILLLLNYSQSFPGALQVASSQASGKQPI